MGTFSKTLTILCSLVLLFGCNKYEFKPENVSAGTDTKKTEEPFVPPVDPPSKECEADFVSWQPGPDAVVPCTEICKDGTHFKCNAQTEKQVICKDSKIVDSGITRVTKINPSSEVCPIDPLVDVSESLLVPAEKAKADIMFMLDTSGSMDRDLEKLSKKFKNLISRWQEIDYQIAITNVSLDKWDGWSMDGQFFSLEGLFNHPRTILTRAEKNADQIFGWNIGREQFSGEGNCSAPPYCMAGRPQPLKTIMRAIDNRKTVEGNAPFFRKDSYLVPIIISDVDEREKGGSGAEVTQPETVQSYFKSELGTTMKDMVGFSIVIPPGDEKCLKEQNNLFKGGLTGKYGINADRFAQQTGGFTVSLCEKDFASKLDKISEKLRQIIDTFTLKHVPLNNTLKIEFFPTANIKWTLEGNKILFSEPLPSNTRVNVTYKIHK